MQRQRKQRVTNGTLEITSTKEALRIRAKQEYIA
jgi:hypothetical protein